MVGVPGKSKACHECKRRRVKCDFSRPRCSRCTKIGRDCPGYEQRRFFVNRTIQDPHCTTVKALARVTTEDNSARTLISELDDLTKSLPLPFENPQNFRSLAFKLLRTIYVPRAVVSDAEAADSAIFAWISGICELCQPNEALDHALLAWCTALGYVEEPDVIPSGRAYNAYSDALRVLSETLSSKLPTHLEYTLAAIVALSTCEIFICHTDDGWRAHIQGIADVIRLRSYQEAPARRVPAYIWNKLCSRLRIISVLSSLTQHQKSPLTRLQWSQLMPDNANEDLTDNLFNIVCELPHAIEEAEIAARSLEPDGKPVAKRLLQVLVNMYEWQSRMRQSAEPPLYSAKPSQLINPADEGHTEQLFPFALSFRSLLICTYFVLSWAISLQTHATLLLLPEAALQSNTGLAPLLRSIYDPGFDEATTPLKQIIKDEADRLARLLCQTVEYCHQPEMGILGPQTMLYTQWLMRSYFRQVGAERELAWCLNVPNMRGAPTRCSIKTMSFQGDATNIQVHNKLESDK